jgi:hypothetical protein
MGAQLRRALGLAIALPVLALAGCGSGGTSTTTASTSAPTSVPTSTQQATTTKPSFIARAEGICRALSAHEAPLKARQESLKGLPTSTADKDFVSLVRQVVSLSRATVGRLRALPQPPADAAAIDRLLMGLSEETTDAADIAVAAVAQESNSGEAAEDALRRSIADNRRLAAQYGMRDCFGSE